MLRYRLLLLVLTTSLCAQTRYARLGELDGAVEAQIHPSEPARPAMRNMPLLESSWVRTGAASHAEIELDEGSVLRLAENSVCELSDYTRLSTGQRITHISLDRGIAYFTGSSNWRDALVLATPSSQVSIRRGSRVRLEATPDASRIAVLEGEARVIAPAIELDIREGRMLRLDPIRPDKFYLLPEVAALDSDTWSVTRDKLLAGDPTRDRLPGLHYGVRDLDASGEWIDTAEFGLAWKPEVPSDWAPFRNGRWQWYDGLGFTWIAAESWGWLPYHYGRWMLQPSQGWIWAPGSRRAFKPGEVYWMRGANLVGWGPLAPGESWNGAGTPALYLKHSSTFARYAPSVDMREIDPMGFADAPKDPLTAARFQDSLPAPRLNTERLEFIRSSDRPGLIRLSPSTPPPPPAPIEPPRPPQPARSQPVTQVVPPAPAAVRRAPVEQSIEPIIETYYSAPIWTGIVILNPPEKPRAGRHQPKQGERDDGITGW